MRILSEGQLSLTKFLLVTDQDIKVQNLPQLLTKVLERADFARDLFVFSNISQDTLDYTGPQVNEGSKAILLGLGEKKYNLCNHLPESLPHAQLGNPRLFVPGVLCLQGPRYDLAPKLAQELAHLPQLAPYRWVCLFDDSSAASQSTADFIWHLFTRFEPAADIYGQQQVARFHVGINGPMIFDARLKPWYPGVLEPDPQTSEQVKRRFGTLLNRLEG